jgi:hypothetical protein
LKNWLLVTSNRLQVTVHNLQAEVSQVTVYKLQVAVLVAVFGSAHRVVTTKLSGLAAEGAADDVTGFLRFSFLNLFT